MSTERRSLQSIIFIALGFPAVWAQEPQGGPKKSLAELAAEANGKKVSSPKVYLADDSIEKNKPAIPDISSGATENSAEIIQAIADYRTTHTRNETEDVVHAWFDKHDEILGKAIDENRHIDERQAGGQYVDPSRYNTRNPREYRAEYEADMRNAREDYQTKRQNALFGSRIQQTFSKVRTALRSQGMNFDWFKIRCATGTC